MLCFAHCNSQSQNYFDVFTRQDIVCCHVYKDFCLRVISTTLVQTITMRKNPKAAIRFAKIKYKIIYLKLKKP